MKCVSEISNVPFSVSRLYPQPIHHESSPRSLIGNLSFRTSIYHCSYTLSCGHPTPTISLNPLGWIYLAILKAHDITSLACLNRYTEIFSCTTLLHQVPHLGGSRKYISVSKSERTIPPPHEMPQVPTKQTRHDSQMSV